jgi:CheY-like chemotaxis protein/HPt (histidine-containing phosphotransfer) domain-containing protein
MIDKKRLLGISALEFPAKVADDAYMALYLAHINAFVNSLPGQEEKIMSSLDAKDYGALAKCLFAIHDLLSKLHANKLAARCMGCADMLSSPGPDHDGLEADIIGLLASVTSLSIDLLMITNAEEVNSKKTFRPKGGDRILAVDNSTFFLNNFKRLLYDTHYRLTCVTSGEDALEYLRKNETDLFVLDIDMPYMDGYELARRIKDGGHTAPIVFLTNNADKNSVIKAAHVGADDFIVKTIDKSLIVSRIAKWI